MRKQERKRNWPYSGFLWLLSLLVIYPLAMVLLTSLKEKREANALNIALPRQWLWENYVQVLQSGRIMRSFFNSVFISAITVLLVLTTAALLAFMREGWCSIWIIMIVLTREFAVAGVRLIASAQGVVIPANYWGKAKTVSQMVFTIIIMLLAELDASFNVFANTGWFTLARVSNMMLWITAVLTVVSGVTYFVDSKKIIDFSK